MMKHTIKLSQTSAIVVQPGRPGSGGAVLEIQHRTGPAASSEAITLGPDQVGVLLFALAQACRPETTPLQVGA